MSNISSGDEPLVPVAASEEPSDTQIVRKAKTTVPLVNQTIVENTTGPIVKLERHDPVTPTDLPIIIINDCMVAQPETRTTEEIPALNIPRQPRMRTVLRRQIVAHKWLSLVLIAILLTGIAIPTIGGMLYGIKAYTTYTTLKSHASSGVQHLLTVKSIFIAPKTATSSASTSKILDTNALQRAKKELAAAQSDFMLVQSTLDHSSFIPLIEQYAPQYRAQITSARAASHVGADVASIGQVVINAALILAPKLRGPLLTSSQTALVTPADLKLIESTIDEAMPYIDDMQQQTQGMSLSDLPINAHQREQVQQLIQLLPQAKAMLVQARSLVDAGGWLLGVSGPRTFLVQTMDRGELRPTGGFTGQYGELHIVGGRVAPFSLRDISLVEYTDNSPTSDKLAPAAYRSWWPFANWGLRDSNLSADFPTSAQIAIKQYAVETHRQVDGVVLFTPFLIEHILQVTGPVRIPSYNETITAQNLEERLHYYQLDNAGIAKQVAISSGDKSTSDRKHFTSLVARTLMDVVRHASPTLLLALGKQMLNDLQTKDLQVYTANTQIQNVLSQYGYAARVDRSTTHDGVYIVQANVSASKASQYVKTTMHDTVTLNAKGGATHSLQIQLMYTQLGFVYGLDTYRDYIRVYVPPTAKFLSGNGFDTGTPLCGGPLVACDARSIYSQDEMVCPAGQYDGGASAPMINDDYTGQWHPLNKVGPPTNMLSDEAGRGMFGGYVVIPKNCTMNVTLSWYVPAIGHAAYSVLVQKQAGTFPELDLTLLPTPGACVALHTLGLHAHTVLKQDTTFILPKVSTTQIGATCYPQPDV